jgi:hypothetical protein
LTSTVTACWSGQARISSPSISLPESAGEAVRAAADGDAIGLLLGSMAEATASDLPTTR